MTRYLLNRLRVVVTHLERLVGGLGTAFLALGGLIWIALVAVLCVVGIGVLLVPYALRSTRAIADRERGRLSRWGPEILSPGPLPAGWRAAFEDIRRDLAWLAIHGTYGLVAGLLGIAMPLWAVQNLSFPFWYGLIPPGEDGPGPISWQIDGLADALIVATTGAGWLALAIGFTPALARAQAWPGRKLLTPPPGTDLSLRVAELTATRAAALDAHAVELRRIERSLHDGTQNRLVAVTVLLGAARRALDRNPELAADVLDKAQDAAEQALAELRTVVRGILPPVLADRGLAGALSGLAGSAGVPCRLEVDLPGRCAASVEATAYFVAAEALSNVAKHSGASSATVTARREQHRLFLTITDDGHGGADEAHGSGLSGIRRRVEAYDGRLTLDSPPGGPTTMQVELPCGS
ncbi:MAG: sensor domain-containing protein [Actinoplanes sp.]